MQIGIIGINKYAKFLNFACDLHVYAFQQFLAQNGYESTILDYKPAYFGHFDMREPAPSAEAAYRRAIKTAPPKDPEALAAYNAKLSKLAELAEGYRSAESQRRTRYDKFEKFVEKNLTFTTEQYDSDLLEVRDPGFDCYICVTDVIWQSIPNHTFDRGFLLGSKAFEGKRKISYAASRGASGDFDQDTATQFFNYLSDIDAISVREQDFNDYITNNSPYESTTVMDPVMLHDADFWSNIATAPNLERYIVLYYVMERASDTITKAVEYAKLHDLTVVELSDRPNTLGRITDPDVKRISRYDVGMEEWLGYIKNAEAIFTNSFHGCCFSVIFEKPFFVGARNGNKVPNFLATLNLSDRRFGSNTPAASLSTAINYDQVKEILSKERSHSESFILSALKEAETAVARGTQKDTTRFTQQRHALTYPAAFHSGKTSGVSIDRQTDAPLATKKLKSGALEYRYSGLQLVNSGDHRIPQVAFNAKGLTVTGWSLRIKIDNSWFWVMQDGSLVQGTLSGKELTDPKLIIPANGTVPHLPVNRIRSAVFTAQWGQPNSDPTVQEAPLRTPSATTSQPRRGIKQTLRRFLKHKR